MKNSIYLIGEMKENFAGKKLPTGKEVMSVFFYEHTVLKKVIKESSKNTITKLSEIWYAAEIPTCGLQYAASKVTKMFKSWKSIQKNCKQTMSAAQKIKENIFLENLNKLFDISKKNVEELLDDDKKLFFLSQKSPTRYGFIDSNITEMSTATHDDIMEVDDSGNY